MAIFWTIVIVGLLIFVHEGGHFLIARWCGVSVRKFSLGFGPKVIGKKIGETEYVVSAIPFGGYVKLLGESPKDEITKQEMHYAFVCKPLFKRTLIVLAGPIANLFFAIIIFMFLFMIYGYPHILPNIGEIVKASPAALAGFKPGDMIISVNDQTVNTWEELATKIQKGKGTLNIKIKRDKKIFSLKVTPRMEKVKNIFGEEIQRSIIGIVASGEIRTEHLLPWDATIKALSQTFAITKSTLVFIGKLISGKLSLSFLKESVAGPIGIAQLTSKTAAAGFAVLWSFAAQLSIMLGILNLLPIPILDGGHLLFYLIEFIKRKPLSIKTTEIAQGIGLAILISLMLLVTYNDIIRIMKKSLLP